MLKILNIRLIFALWFITETLANKPAHISFFCHPYHLYDSIIKCEFNISFFKAPACIISSVESLFKTFYGDGRDWGGK